MQLHPPFEISSRLMASVKIAGATISLECVGVRNNRLVYHWYIDLPDGREFDGTDLETPRDNLQEAMAALLAFLGACGEAYGYRLGTGRKSENEGLFPPAVAKWAYQHSDELGALQAVLEESPGLIEE